MLALRTADEVKKQTVSRSLRLVKKREKQRQHNCSPDVAH